MDRYLLDSNIYINFYDRAYKFDYFPSFWDRLPNILNRCVVIPKIVVAENYQNELFRAWLDSNYDNGFLNHKEYAQQWGEVLQFIGQSDCYKLEALTSDKGWAHERIADPWIIAIAKKENLTVVTNEIRNPNLNNPNGNKSAKIPDVCDALGVKCIDMNEFFGEVALRV